MSYFMIYKNGHLREEGEQAPSFLSAIVRAISIAVNDETPVITFVDGDKTEDVLYLKPEKINEFLNKDVLL